MLTAAKAAAEAAAQQQHHSSGVSVQQSTNTTGMYTYNYYNYRLNYIYVCSLYYRYVAIQCMYVLIDYWYRYHGTR